MLVSHLKHSGFPRCRREFFRGQTAVEPSHSCAIAPFSENLTYIHTQHRCQIGNYKYSF